MNEEIVLPLERMTIAKKMDVIERIMEDLSRNSADVPSPDWHGEILRQREENLRNGTDRFLSLEEAKVRIREMTGRK